MWRRTWRDVCRHQGLNDTGSRGREDGLDDDAVDGEQRQDRVVVVAVVVESGDPGRIGRAGVREEDCRDDDSSQQEDAEDTAETS